MYIYIYICVCVQIYTHSYTHIQSVCISLEAHATATQPPSAAAANQAAEPYNAAIREAQRKQTLYETWRKCGFLSCLHGDVTIKWWFHGIFHQKWGFRGDFGINNREIRQAAMPVSEWGEVKLSHRMQEVNFCSLVTWLGVVNC